MAVPALLLNLALKWLEALHINPLIENGIEALELLIFYGDVLLYMIFLIRSAVDTVVHLWKWKA